MLCGQAGSCCNADSAARRTFPHFKDIRLGTADQVLLTLSPLLLLCSLCCDSTSPKAAATLVSIAISATL